MAAAADHLCSLLRSCKHTQCLFPRTAVYSTHLKAYSANTVLQTASRRHCTVLLQCVSCLSLHCAFSIVMGSHSACNMSYCEVCISDPCRAVDKQSCWTVSSAGGCHAPWCEAFHCLQWMTNTHVSNCHHQTSSPSYHHLAKEAYKCSLLQVHTTLTWRLEE